jgi:hypothetical protein
MAALSVPGAAVMTLAGGALFGVVLGTIAVSLASTIGATLVFWPLASCSGMPCKSASASAWPAINQGVEKRRRVLPARPAPGAGVSVLDDQPGHGAHTDSDLDLFLGQLARHASGHRGLRQCRHPAGAHRFSRATYCPPQLIGAFVPARPAAAAAALDLRFLQRRKVYRGHRKPKRFDYNLVVIGAGAAGLVSAYIGTTVRPKSP